MERESGELKHLSYELFIGALSVLSIVNLVLIYAIPNPDLETVVLIMNGFFSLVFFGDFLYRIFTAESKSEYFFRQFGWADLGASLPFTQVKILRVFRLIRVARLIRRYGFRSLAGEFLGNRGGSALLTVLFFMALVLEFGSLAVLGAEVQSPDSNIKTGSDAIWYTYVTITTVGYGDRYPVTQVGRIVGVIILTTGVGLFGTLTGFLANAFLAPKKEPAPEEPAPPAPNGAGPSPEQVAELRDLLAQLRQAEAAVLRQIGDPDEAGVKPT
jgi:voltage-gated potassium channel